MSSRPSPVAHPIQSGSLPGLYWLMAFGFLLAALLWLGPADAAAQQQPHNVLLLLIDDLRADLAGFAGGPAATPNLDRLQKEAVYFTHAMTTTGLCSPARAALFTGRLGHRQGVDDNVRTWHSRNTGLSLTQTTLVEWAREQGYFVGFIGKWHLGRYDAFRRGAHRTQSSDLDEGGVYGVSNTRPDFEAVRRYYDTSQTYEEKPGFYAVQGKTFEDAPVSKKVKAATEFLREARQMKTPFFLTITTNLTHPPYVPPADYARQYDPANIVLPANLNDPYENKPPYHRDIMWPFHDLGHMTEQDWRRARAYALAELTLLDDAVGRILAAVEENGFKENTAVIFVSDQGSMLGEHGLFDKGPYAYDELMRIPLLVRMPGIRPKRVERQVSIIDLNHTLVDWMGLAPSRPGIDSRSLMPLLRGGDSGMQGPDEAFYRYEWYNGRWFGVRTIRTPEAKYSWNPAGPDELYDLKRDPLEIRNLALEGSYREVLRDLQQRLLAHLETVEDPLFGEMKRYVEASLQ